MYSNILLVYLLSLSVLTFYLSYTFAQSCSRDGDKRVTSIGNLSNVIQICLNSNNRTLEWKFLCFNDEGLGDISTNEFCLGMAHIGSAESYESSNNNLKLVLTNCDGNKYISYCNFTSTCNYVNESDYCHLCHNSLEPKCELDVDGTSQQNNNEIGIVVGSVLSVILIVIALFSIILVLIKCMRVKNRHHGDIRSVSHSCNRYSTLMNNYHTDRTTPLMADDSFDSYLSENLSYERRSRIESAGGSFDSIDPIPQMAIPSVPPSNSSLTAYTNSSRKYESQIQPKSPTTTKSKSNLLDCHKEEDFYTSILDGYVDTEYYASISKRGVSKNHHLTSSGRIYVEPPRYIKSLRHDPNIEVNKDKLKIGQLIAQGQFGIVYSAQYSSPDGTIDVAVKKLKDYTNNEAENEFIKEAMILNQFKHPNVLKLIGVVSSSPYMMITELLKSELRELLLKLKESYFSSQMVKMR
ncbi:Ephrin type-B receptor 2-like isoform X7 [Oopsacas minuta]|uniref:Ephrin type-B receptor 2-like isoform X7 n=1 Tax=Oopsacas minuta TaxID=111878 RepID=A0AAV7KCF5_9METZ|nr:Ephrin type-B receptor 2-like isoform X7 [Oopsacas minuta]